MAKAATYAAYQRLTPIGTDFSDDLLKREQLEFKYREENRQIQAAKDKAEARLTSDMMDDISAIQPVITGVNSVDEINYRAAGLAQQRIGEIYREFRDNPESQNDVNKRMELANLKKFPTNLKSVEGKLTQYAQDLSKGFADGTYSKWDKDKMDELGAFFGIKDKTGRISPNYIIDFDETGNMKAKAITQDGRYFERSVLDMLNGYTYSTATKATDSNEYTTNIAKELGKREDIKVGGGMVQEYQDFSAHEGGLRNTIRESLGNISEPTDLAKSIWADEENMNRNPVDFNENSIKEIEDYLVGQIGQKYDETIRTKFTPRRGGRGDRQDGVPGQNIRLMRRTDTGEPVVETIVRTDPSDETEAISFSIGTPITTGTGDKQKKINTLMLDSETGEVIYKGEQPTKVGGEPILNERGKKIGTSPIKTAFEPVTGGGLNQEEVNSIARRLGFNNAVELKSYLQSLVPSNGGVTEETDKGILD